MSEFAVSKTATGAERPPVPSRGTAISVVHESYSFACMRCGHGWEQSYEIEHHVDGDGAEFVKYVANGERVPSPLTRPTCLNCGGNVVRIMRAGRVSSVLDVMHPQHHQAPAAGPVEAPEPGVTVPAGERHHWHLSDLLHPFGHHKKEA
ncbi:hypothetical protein OKJ48_25940 [Streptomyces kunmingensis]|uniref:C2H2-type domain-containing protein n=1 Tax=Streptomyces kunmingensis TaxID=68225 RepID=A0ABU6CG13_9ACTN|nr:hypothetical protein [Streptomyces kunmingensis]MEB3963656.1 hypothetical protein [Streptomyces kunmingensis]